MANRFYMQDADVRIKNLIDVMNGDEHVRVLLDRVRPEVKSTCHVQAWVKVLFVNKGEFLTAFPST